MNYQSDGSIERRKRKRFDGSSAENRASNLQSGLQSSLNNLIVRCPEAIDCDCIAVTQRLILGSFASDTRLERLVIDMSQLKFIDRFDFERMIEMFQAVRLMGRSVALCGIQPAIAVLFVEFDIDLSLCTVAQGLEDVLSKVSKPD